MIDFKHFDVVFEGDDVFVVQTKGPHSNKSRYFGRLHIKANSIKAHRGFLFEEDNPEDLVVGEFSGTNAFKKALEAISQEYDDSFLPDF